VRRDGNDGVVAARRRSARLCLVNGSFSKRYAEIAESVGKQVVKLSVPMGQSVALDALEKTLGEKGPFDAVTLVSNETSSGVRTPLPSSPP
jgi:aspartate aminotransferase-like enzyme